MIMLCQCKIDQLKADLKGVTVLTPDSDGYADSIKRWSDLAERRAVNPSTIELLRIDQSNNLKTSRAPL